jgi:hypothetical protein
MTENGLYVSYAQPFADKLVMDPARMAWARALVDRLGG